MAKKFNILAHEHFGIQRKIVSNMTVESWESIPHAVVTYNANVDEFMKVYKEINVGRTPETKLTINTMMLRIIVEGLKACPSLNAHISFDRKLVRGNIKTIEEIDISMPMILKNGKMMTVNMHNMHNKTMSEMRDSIADKARRANNTNLDEVMYEVSLDYTLQGLADGKVLQTIRRVIGSLTGKHKITTLKGKAKKEYYAIPDTERLTKHDIEQGTITVSNLGSVCRNWDGVCTLLEIVPPQVCAIGIGSIQKTPIVDKNNNVVAGSQLPFTIAFDHRALDMGDITPFIDKLNEIFDNPEVLKEWV